jgi:hypothetical protein
MKKIIYWLSISAALLSGALFAAAPALASTSVIYNALPDPLPPNAPSQPFQAQQTFEFGDYIHLGGTDRNLTMITVAMSDWALYSDYSSDVRYSGNPTTWTHPITINVYSNHLNSNGVPDTLLATKTQDINIPWRPAEDPVNCPTKSDSGYAYKWQSTPGPADTNCNNGLAFNAVFDLSSLNVTLPEDIIVSLAYNTESYGTAPIGSSGPYNSLNVLVPNNQPVTVGSDDSNSEVFWNTVTANWYADKGAAGVGVFRKDTNWSPNGTIAMKIEANVPANVTTNPATPVAQTTATVHGTNGPVDADDTSFWLGTTSAGPFTSSADPASELPSGWSGVDSLTQLANASFSYDYTGLTPGTTYYFVAWSLVGGTWYPGAVLQFITTLPAQCNPNATQAIVSDTSTQDTTDAHAAVAVTPHPAWTSISLATWIYSDALDANGSSPTGDKTFTRTFTITGTPLDSSLEIAADNMYTVSVNGNSLNTGTSAADLDNFSSSKTWTIPAVDLLTGSNTITFTVTNPAVNPADQTPFGDPNPGGLLYKLTINNNECVTPQQQPYVTTNPATPVAQTTATVHGTNGPVDADDTSFWLGTTSAGPFTPSADPASELPSGWSGVDSLTQLANASFSYDYTGLTPGTTYYFVAWSLVGGTWYPGAVLQFTTTNTGSLVVTKQSVGGDGTFNFTSDIPGNSTFSITTNGGTGSQTFNNLVPGTYHVTEVSQKKWTQTENSCSEITLVAGDNPACVVINTNNKLLGSIRGFKFEDWDGDHSPFESRWEKRLSSWTIYLDTNDSGTLDSGEPTAITDKHGLYFFGGLVAGTYHVREVGKDSWVQTYPLSGKYDVVLTTGQNAKNKNFGNFKLGTISGMKFEDKNGNRRKDKDEVGLQGWTINLTKVGSPAIVTSATTDANGKYSFTDLGPGIYKVREVQQTGWVQTTINPQNVKINSGRDAKNENFGNHNGPLPKYKGHNGNGNDGFYPWINH